MAQVARGKALVAKLRAQAGVRNPEALAAYLGRFKKARNAGKSVAVAKRLASGDSDKGADGKATPKAEKKDSDGISTKARQEIEQREEKIRNLPYEASVIVDNDGNLLSETTQRREGEVIGGIDAIVKSRDGKGITTHNHPSTRMGETSFSEGDFKHFLQFRPAEMRVVTPNYTFRLRGPEKGWGDRAKPKALDNSVATDIQQIRTIVEIKARAWKAQGVSSREMDFRKTDEIARLFAKAYGLRYDVERKK